MTHSILKLADVKLALHVGNDSLHELRAELRSRVYYRSREWNDSIWSAIYDLFRAWEGPRDPKPIWWLAAVEYTDDGKLGGARVALDVIDMVTDLCDHTLTRGGVISCWASLILLRTKGKAKKSVKCGQKTIYPIDHDIERARRMLKLAFETEDQKDMAGI